jgi:ATPase subunit of ABC transporter with duplicated ATPase domains
MSLGYLHQIYSDDENKTVFEELETGFTDIKKLNQKIEEFEIQMKKDPENMDLIEKYTTLLDQFNNI